MKAMMGLVGLLLALLVVGLLVKKQLAASSASVPLAPVHVSTQSADTPGTVAGQQGPQQFKQALDTAVQASRAMPDDR